MKFEGLQHAKSGSRSFQFEDKNIFSSQSSSKSGSERENRRFYNISSHLPLNDGFEAIPYAHFIVSDPEDSLRAYGLVKGLIKHMLGSIVRHVQVNLAFHITPQYYPFSGGDTDNSDIPNGILLEIQSKLQTLQGGNDDGNDGENKDNNDSNHPPDDSKRDEKGSGRDEEGDNRGDNNANRSGVSSSDPNNFSLKDFSSLQLDCCNENIDTKNRYLEAYKSVCRRLGVSFNSFQPIIPYRPGFFTLRLKVWDKEEKVREAHAFRFHA